MSIPKDISAVDACLPPCGGSGLKCPACDDLYNIFMSPSMRREWIEMQLKYIYSLSVKVSLHAEGVD